MSTLKQSGLSGPETVATRSTFITFNMCICECGRVPVEARGVSGVQVVVGHLTQIPGIELGSSAKVYTLNW